MPNYDGTGPLGTGPRMGRGLGRCGRPADSTTAVEGPDPDYRAGRGRGAGMGGRVRHRGFGKASEAKENPADSDVTPGQRQALFGRRIKELTTLLKKVNQLLSEDSRAGGQEQE